MSQTANQYQRQTALRFDQKLSTNQEKKSSCIGDEVKAYALHRQNARESEETSHGFDQDPTHNKVRNYGLFVSQWLKT